MKRILLPRLQKDTQAQIVRWIREQMPPWATGAVLGMSGGIDSSVVAALTAKAFRDTKYTLRAYSLPTHINTPDDWKDAQIIANLYDIQFEVMSIEHMFEATVATIPNLSAYDKGNTASRLRAVVLWGLAGRDRSIVMGTGNKDEDYGVGYYTLTGDGLVHLNPLGFLPKRLVRELGAELGFPPRIVKRVASAGLELDQTDEGDLGYIYEFPELVVAGLDQGFALTDIVNHPQLCVPGLLSNGPKAKWANNPDGRLHAVLDVLARHDIAKAKAALVCPKVPNIVLPKE